MLGPCALPAVVAMKHPMLTDVAPTLGPVAETSPTSRVFEILGGSHMPRGDKSACTDKQKRQAEHIEEGYEHRGVPKDEAESRAWATVNKMSGGGKKSGSGRGKATNLEPARKGGRIGGSSQSTADRSAAAKKGWETRRSKA